MPKAKAVTRTRQKKNSGAKENKPDTDLQVLNKVVTTSVAAPVVVHNQPAKPVKPEPAPKPGQAPATHNNYHPGVSSLTDQQREEITALLSQPKPPSMRAVARNLGVTFAAVKYLVDKNAIDSGSLALVRQKSYERRLGKRLPVSDRVKIYASVARGEAAGAKASDQLRALERIEALEGIVTAREQRESESNQVHVGPLFVLPAAASPVVDAVRVDVRPIQDKA